MPVIKTNIANASSTCTTYGLFWKSGGKVDPSNTSDFITNPGILIQTEADADGNPSAPLPTISQSMMNASSTHYSDPSVEWKCVDSSLTPEAVASNSEGSYGLEECQAAVVIAQKYGYYSLLSEGLSGTIDKFKQQIIQNYVNKGLEWLQNQATNLVGNVSLSKLFGISTTATIADLAQDPAKVIKLAGDVTGINQTLKDMGNEVAKDVQDKVKGIMQGFATKYGGELVKQAKDLIGLGGGGAASLPGVNPVPTNDVNTQTELKKVQAKQDQQMLEAKRQELIAHTRAQCHVLLTQTVQHIKSSLLYQWTTQTVDWIEGGGITIENGQVHIQEPQFVKQPGKFLAQVGWEATNRFISHAIPQLCEPFRLAVTLNIPSTARQTNPYYDPNITCTINQVVQNIQDFYNNFSSGGWLGYREIMMPQNNYYDVSLNLMQKASEIQDSAQNNAQNMLNQNSGFANQVICTQWEKYVSNSNSLSDCNQSLNNALNTYNVDYVWDGNTNLCEADNGSVNSIRIQPNPSSTPIAIGIPDDSSVLPQTDNLSARDFLYHYETSTSEGLVRYECTAQSITQSGSIAKNLAQKVTSADIDAIINAQDLTNIDEILQNAIMNKITKVGIRGLKGILSNLPTWTGNFVNSWQQWINYK